MHVFYMWCHLDIHLTWFGVICRAVGRIAFSWKHFSKHFTEKNSKFNYMVSFPRSWSACSNVGVTGWSITYYTNTKKVILQMSPYPPLYHPAKKWNVKWGHLVMDDNFLLHCIGLCVVLCSSSIIVCHLHKVERCHACWQWYKYLSLSWCFRVTNLQRPPLDLLTVPGLMGNNDTDGLTANSPSGHLACCRVGWLRRRPTTGHSLIFFFNASPCPPLGLPLIRLFSIELSLNFDRRESASEGHCQCPFHTIPSSPCCVFFKQMYTLRYPLTCHLNEHAR